MQIIKSFLILLLLGKITISNAQSIYLDTRSADYHLLDRLEIKNADSSIFNHFATKPVTRKSFLRDVEILDSTYKKSRYKDSYELSDVDFYNLDKLKMSNLDYLSKPTNAYNSKKVFLNRFFQTKANFYEVNQKDFKLIANPLIYQVQSVEVGNKKRVYLNSKGLELRGMIANKVGFYTSLTDNQENGPSFYATRVDSLNAVPGMGFFKPFKQTSTGNKGQDYFDYRGYIAFKAFKFLDVQYGYDKNFIGNGYRSLLLSHNAAPTLFLKLNTKVWKLNYQNLFMELNPTFTSASGGDLFFKKYVAMHYLDIQIAPNLNLGVFESVTFKRRNKFDFAYMVPVIFYRAVESGLGSADNAMIGMDFKLNFEQHFQLYGQAALDEFKLSGIKNRSWTNKAAVQAGFKYIDVANIKNFDLQFEWNIVRPYMYSHFDSSTSYSHYNQALAHPSGANFTELIAIAKYQPTNKIKFESKFIYTNQGQDSSSNSHINYGGNIFRTTGFRPVFPGVNKDDGMRLLQGIKASTVYFYNVASYEYRPNVYLEGSLLLRTFKKFNVRDNSAVISLGVRWNMNRREYDYN